uniref:Uncharacterized protein n=1 Tax=Candidatus Kentrum sp. TUN TaxID=2126343 RepID=A0A451A9T9_9GAMM|nr:MAG: hypothetical protein BECKTUN1418F_GA0071002_108815 [Candidatus Kentron sp. TUN]VFK62798.1 MAG: hypothetical protein BECKTUN1418E_GA0071001_108616 [Candidatus Kentron sp. TUN]VFK64027.1 MAG: hypothetical protein BECKTUN1418D_GA0071000_12393 [Candidatus Kentron sp. TUN]
MSAFRVETERGLALPPVWVPGFLFFRCVNRTRVVMRLLVMILGYMSVRVGIGMGFKVSEKQEA